MTKNYFIIAKTVAKESAFYCFWNHNDLAFKVLSTNEGFHILRSLEGGGDRTTFRQDYSWTKTKGDVKMKNWIMTLHTFFEENWKMKFTFNINWSINQEMKNLILNVLTYLQFIF